MTLPPLAWGSEERNLCITGSVQSEKEVVPLHPSQHCTASSHERTADATGLCLFRLLAVFLVGGSVYSVASFYLVSSQPPEAGCGHVFLVLRSEPLWQVPSFP